ncbi:hypothetical protein BLEM_0603 [Bifidobacterium lemurum]|uniref:Phage protein Gp19/Gp15/Gp42 n=1 Tax=Bifidobacterium lemurum TaxID=1603886 RepID=A0A261FV97_9BIFI|nr:hypothetical protein [Bifidobacterium lemurum]OZG62686.1 hypothetical protein BLEM_0603 [Bifidobacterium lemurum]QOL34597.1 hypothetical protein BL8807_01285 [Bifidobacterium lemurum]
MADEQQKDELTERLTAFVDATDFDADAIADSLETARAYLVARFPTRFEQLAKPIRDDIVVTVAADLYGQKDARSGVMAVASTDSVQPFRVSGDPLRAAWPKLRAAGLAVGLGIA